MKNLLTKIRSKHLLISFWMSLVAFMVIFAIHGFQFIYETNDDFGISLFITNGYNKCLFVSYFLTSVLMLLQKIFTTVNIWILSQLFFNFISLTIITYVFILKFGLKIGCFFSLLINIVFGYFSFVSLQYTRMPPIIASAGYLLILYSLFSDKKNEKLINSKSLIGCLLVLISSFYRYYSFLSVSGIFFVFIFVIVLMQWFKAWKEKTRITYLHSIKKLLLLITVFIVAFALENVSNYIKNSDSQYFYHSQYHLARTGCVDIPISSYEGNESFYNSIGIISENDLDVLTAWTGDENFFSLERMSEIAKYSQKDASFIHNFGNSITMIYSIINNKFGSLCIPVISIFIIGSVIFLVTVVILRNKLKWIFPVLFAISWIGFFYLFFALYNYEVMYLAVFPGIFMIFTAFLSNRYHFIVVCLVSGVVFLLTLYLNFVHTNFRATYTFIFPAMCIAIYNFDKDNIRVNVRKINPVLKKGICCAGTVVYLTIAVIISRTFYVFPSLFLPTTEKESDIFTYVENHKENFYLMDVYIANKNFDKPMLKAEIPDNSITTSWIIGSAFSKQVQKKYHVENLYGDMIDNPHAFYLSWAGKEHIKKLEKYYNDHYSNGKNNIVFERVENNVMEVYRIYKKN